MKKIIALAVAALLGVAAFAQDWYIGGRYGVSGTKGQGLGISIAPDIGYCLTDNIYVGAILGFDNQYATFTRGLNGDYSLGIGETAWEFCPYVRYIPWSDGPVNLFVDGCLDIFGGKELNTLSGALEPYTGFNFVVCPGLSIDLSERFSVDFTLGMFGYNPDENTFGFNVGGITEIGFYFSF